jgi:hypothetical protein
MLTYRAMRWKLSSLELAGPWTPYHHAFPHLPPTILLTAPERSSVNILKVFSPPFLFFFSWVVEFKLMSAVGQSENDLIIMMI